MADLLYLCLVLLSFGAFAAAVPAIAGSEETLPMFDIVRGLAVAAGLLIYLVAVLLRPQKF